MRTKTTKTEMKIKRPRADFIADKDRSQCPAFALGITGDHADTEGLFTMRYLILTLTILGGLAAAVAPAKADCRWEWNGNSMQQICR